MMWNSHDVISKANPSENCPFLWVQCTSVHWCGNCFLLLEAVNEQVNLFIFSTKETSSFVKSHNKAGAAYKSTINPLVFLNGNTVLLLRSYISKWSQIFNSCIIHFINYDQVKHLLKFHNVQFMGKREKPLSSHWSISIPINATGLQQMS